MPTDTRKVDDALARCNRLISFDVNEILRRSGRLLTPLDVEVLYKTASEIKAKNIVEIGSRFGGSASIFADVVMSTGGHLYCIDPFILDLLKKNLRLINALDYVTFVQGKSPWIDPSKVATPIDYLFIDGDHRARWTLADYHYWFPFVRAGGRIAFHDVHTLDWAGQGVRRAIELILATDSDIIKLVAETDDVRYRGTKVFEKASEQAPREKRVVDNSDGRTFVLVHGLKDSKSLERLSESIAARGYDSRLVSQEDTGSISSCDILMLYNVVKDPGVENIQAGRKVIYMTSDPDDLGATEWLKGWDAYGFTRFATLRTFVNKHKGTYVFILPAFVDLHPFLSSEPTSLNRTLSVASVLSEDSEVAALERLMSIIKTFHSSCYFHFVDPNGIAPSASHVVKYKPSAISLEDLFRKSNCFWLPVPENLLDKQEHIELVAKAAASGLPVVTSGKYVGQLAINEIGWVCENDDHYKKAFAQIDGKSLSAKGARARLLASVHFNLDAWVSEILGLDDLLMQEVASVPYARGGLLTVLDARALYSTADKIEAKNILEIGSRAGGTTVFLGSVAKKHGGRLYCVEPLVRAALYENIKLAGLEDHITVIEGASPWVDPSRIATPLDYLFIDGEHFTRWVLADYHHWFPFVRVGGRIAFHDWNERGNIGKMIHEAVDIIMRTDAGSLEKIAETYTERWGVVVFEKVKEQRLTANLIDLGCLPSHDSLQG